MTARYACCQHCWAGHHLHVGRDEHDHACAAPMEGGCLEGAREVRG